MASGPSKARRRVLPIAGFLPLAATGNGLSGAVSLLWPFPAVISSTLLIAWASEVASFFVSRGFALAVLAFLQVLPEFAVEAVIAASAARDASQLIFVTANFTGANRILVGLALPLIFFITMWVRHRAGREFRELRVPDLHTVEVMFLLIPSAYSLWFFFKDEIDLLDTLILFAMYGVYLWVLYRLPPAGADEKELLHGVPARVAKRSVTFQKRFAVGAFLLGGLVLFVSVETFYHNMLALAAAIGISAYFLVQWLAPLLSEFPEFLTATYWSRMSRGEVAFFNIVSAKINQWTLLIGMIPLVFAIVSFTEGRSVFALPLDAHQQVEVLLTAAQGLFAVVCLLKMRFLAWEAGALLFLWAFQLIDPLLDPFLIGVVPAPFGTEGIVREWTTLVYFALIGLEAAIYGREWRALATFRVVVRTYVKRPIGEKPAP